MFKKLLAPSNYKTIKIICSNHHYKYIVDYANKDNKPIDAIIAEAIQCYIGERTYSDIVKNGL